MTRKTFVTPPANTASNSRRGVVLLLVLMVIMMLSLAAYTFSDLMLTEREATVLHGEQVQSRVLVESGVDAVRLYLSQDYSTRTETGGHYDNPAEFQGLLVVDDEDPHFRGRFAILAPALDGYGYFSDMRFGLENESARLNLNALVAGGQLDEAKQRELMMAMPGMTEDVADAILDWVDEDEEPRELGAEAEYYGSLDPPYEPKNGPLDTVEELLLVRGITPELLFGLDSNRNGMVDAHELNSSRQTQTASVDISTFGGLLDRGWSAYLTLHSAERNVNAIGLSRIDINAENLEQLHADLTEVFDEDIATFICAYRQNGPYEPGNNNQDQNQAGGSDGGERGDSGGGGSSGGGSSGGNPQPLSDGPSGSGGGGGGQSFGGGGGGGGNAITITSSGGGSETPMAVQQGSTSAGSNQGTSGQSNEQDTPGEPVDGREIDLAQPGGTEIEQLLDLIDKRVQVTFDGDRQPTILASPFPNDPDIMPDYLPTLMDELTTNTEPVIPGRVNINEAPQAVLMAIPEMDEQTVDQILALRDPTGLAGDGTQTHESWLLQDGIVDVEKMKALLPYVTTRGDVYRAQVVGYFDAGNTFNRAEVIIDATVPLPGIVFWRDLAHLGRGFPVDALGAEVSRR